VEITPLMHFLCTLEFLILLLIALKLHLIIKFSKPDIKFLKTPQVGGGVSTP
jgi:hypothetical protein